MSNIPPVNQHFPNQAKEKNTVTHYKYCIYTIASKKKLDEAAKTHKQHFVSKEGRPWKTAKNYIENANSEGSQVPIILADAGNCSRLLYWGLLESIKIGDKGTTYKIDRLRPLQGEPKTQELTLAKSGKKIARGFIRPYALCNTPKFLIESSTESDTASIAQSMAGEKLYQKRARAALPLLVRQANAGTPISYSDLAAELGMPNPRNLNFVLGSIGRSLEQLSKSWKKKIPPIQCLVINKETGLPGEGIGHFLIKKLDYTALPIQKQKIIVKDTLQDIFLYPHWEKVLNSFSLRPTKTNFTLLVSKASKKTGWNGGRGEGKRHKILKEYVSRHPELIGLKSSTPIGKKEFPLPSGDSLDVSFDQKNLWVAVEVKSKLSTEADITRGLYQCVKYQAIMEAVLKSESQSQNVRTVLVLESSLPQLLIGLKNTLGIEVVDEISPMPLKS